MLCCVSEHSVAIPLFHEFVFFSFQQIKKINSMSVLCVGHRNKRWFTLRIKSFFVFETMKWREKKWKFVEHLWNALQSQKLFGLFLSPFAFFFCWLFLWKMHSVCDWHVHSYNRLTDFNCSIKQSVWKKKNLKYTK